MTSFFIIFLEVFIISIKNKFFKIDAEFFKESNLKNMLDPNNEKKQSIRPYYAIQTTINNVDYLIPLRSNLNHPNGISVPSRTRKNAGLDFSHALIVDEKHLSEFTIPRDQFSYINKNMNVIEKKFTKYLKRYVDLVGKGKLTKGYSISTLVNYDDTILDSFKKQNKWNGNSKLNKNYKGCNLNSVGVK